MAPVENLLHVGTVAAHFSSSSSWMGEQAPHAAVSAPAVLGGCTPQRQLLLPKALYLILLAGISGIVSFTPLFLYEKKGLTYEQIGIIGLMTPFANSLGSPFWSAFVDYTHLYWPTYVGTLAISIVLNWSQWWVMQFEGICAITFFASFFGCAFGPMLDNGVLHMLPDKTEWGQQRLWGAVGFGIMSLIIGLLLSKWHTYLIMFILYTVMMVWGIYLSRNLKLDTRSEDKKHEKARFTRILRVVCSSVEVVTFFVVVLVSGVANGVLESFLFIFIDDIGGTKTLQGLARAVMCGAEIPFFWYAGRIIKRVTVPGVLAITCVSYIARFMFYALLKEPWLVLVAEPLHGLTFALMWAACTDYAFDLSPPGLGTTMQGVLSCVHWGFGQAAGSLLGGVLMGRYGARLTFEGAACLSGLALVLLAIVHAALWLHRKTRRGKQVAYSHLEADSEAEARADKALVSSGVWESADEQMAGLADPDASDTDMMELVPLAGMEPEPSDPVEPATKVGDRANAAARDRAAADLTWHQA